MANSTVQLGRERVTQRYLAGLLQVLIGSALVAVIILGFGPQDDMRVVLKILGGGFIFAGFHTVFHYRVVRVLPPLRKILIGYRWYFWNSLREASFDEYASVRVIRGHRSDTRKSRTTLLMLTNTKYDFDELVVEDTNFDLVLERGKTLARATNLPLFIEHAKTEKREQVEL